MRRSYLRRTCSRMLQSQAACRAPIVAAKYALSRMPARWTHCDSLRWDEWQPMPVDLAEPAG
jgi:hypothetical protein